MIGWLIVVILITVGWIAWPVLQKTLISEQLQDPMQDPVAYWQHQKQELYQSIRELDFDFETGKLSKQDYQELRKSIEKETIEAMKQLDQAKQTWANMEQNL